jgi:hypothetical protein
MKLKMKQLESGKFGIFEEITNKCVLVCNRAYNADMIANILSADEEQEVCKNVKFDRN